MFTYSIQLIYIYIIISKRVIRKHLSKSKFNTIILCYMSRPEIIQWIMTLHNFLSIFALGKILSSLSSSYIPILVKYVNLYFPACFSLLQYTFPMSSLLIRCREIPIIFSDCINFFIVIISPHPTENMVAAHMTKTDEIFSLR